MALRIDSDRPSPNNTAIISKRKDPSGVNTTGFTSSLLSYDMPHRKWQCPVQTQMV